MNVRKYDFFSDPGHGWLKVPKAELVKLGIVDKISKYSYMRGDCAFLEEDADATLFIEEMEKRGFKVEFRESNADKDSRIRNYESFKS
jgi:hypothetical protein